MKKKFLAFAVFAPILASSQCFNPLTADSTIAMQLKPVIEKYSGTNLVDEPAKRIASAYTFGYYNAENTSGLTISIARKKETSGDDASYTQPAVFRVLIYGTADAIDKMFAEYFTPLLEKCATKKSANWFFTPNIKLVKMEADRQDGKQMKTIEIEKVR